MRSILMVLVFLLAVQTSAQTILEILGTQSGGSWTGVLTSEYASFAGRSVEKFDVPVFQDQVVFSILSRFGATGLSRESVVESLAAKHYTFVPTIGGQRVENLALRLVVDNDGFLIGFTARLRKLQPPPGVPKVDRKVIPALLAREAICELKGDDRGIASCNPFAQKTRAIREEDVIGPFLFSMSDGRVVPAYRILIQTESGIGLSEYFVHATAVPPGQLILERRLGLVSARPRARIFRPNPPAMHGDLSIDRNTFPGVASRTYKCVRLSRVKEPGQGHALVLEGNYVLVNNALSGGFNENPVEALQDGSFDAPVGELLFASSMVYYHIDKMQRYVQELGFKNLLAFPIPVDPQTAMSGDFNSHTDMNSDDRIAIYYGWLIDNPRRFDAEDADVIAHEYGHALQWGAAKTRYRPGENEFEVAAVGEGFGDYWAMTSFRKYNRKYRQQGTQHECYAEWSRPGCLRIINLQARRADFSESCDSHRNGNVWTATLWQIAKELGRKDADRLILQSHYSVEDRPNFCGSAIAILRADQGLTKGKNRETLLRIFRERQIVDMADCKLF